MESNPQQPTSVAALLKRYKFGEYALQKNPNASERGEFLKYFTDSINRDRIGTTFKPVGIGFVARKLQGVPTTDLWAFRKRCEEAHLNGFGFSKCFFSSLKVKP